MSRGPIVPSYLLQTDRLHSMLPYQAKPAISFTDYAGQYGSSGLQYVVQTDDTDSIRSDAGFGVEFNPHLGVVYPMRLFVPHDNVDADDSVVSGYIHSSPAGVAECGGLNPVITWNIEQFGGNFEGGSGAIIGTVAAMPIGFCQMRFQVDSDLDLENPDADDANLSGYVFADVHLPAPTQGFTCFTYCYSAGQLFNDGSPIPTYPMIFHWRFRMVSDLVNGKFRWFSLAV